MSEPTQILSDYLTREELARQINRSIRTLERWESSRTGPPITRMGRTPMYRIKSVLTWLKSQEKKPTRRAG